MRIFSKWLTAPLSTVLLASACLAQGSSGAPTGAPGGGPPSGSQGPGSNSPGGGPSANQGAGSGGGFSIEAEILAYKALQSDSEAIACDIAGFLVIPQTGALSPNGPSSTPMRIGCQPPGLMAGTITSGQITAGSVAKEGQRQGTTMTGATLTGATVEQATVTEVSPPARVPQGVIIVSSAGTTLANFQIWRMDMAIMTQLKTRAADYQCPSQEAEHTLSLATGIDVAQQAVTLVQSTLGLFASNESATGVPGTIQDQALMDSVGRQLRNLGVSVLMPDTYGPFTFTGVDYDSSPFFQNIAILVRSRICLQQYLKQPANQVDSKKLSDDTKALKSNLDKQQADQDLIDQGKVAGKALADKFSEIATLKDEAEKLKSTIKENTEKQNRASNVTSLIASIDSFISSLTATTPSPASPNPSASSPNPASTNPSATNPTSQMPGGQQAPPSQPNNSPPPISAVLAADGLARELGITADGKSDGKSIFQHVLWLKALESGGLVTTHSNILGSKVFFSGGAVATYALFSLNGRLSCSGNLFDYGGFIRDKDFPSKFRNQDLDPRRHLIFLRGGCASPDEVGSGASQK
jgi:hypothetical protein